MFLFGIILVGAAAAPLMIATVRTNWMATGAGLLYYFVYLRIGKRWVKTILLLAMLAGVGVYAYKGDTATQDQSAAMSAQLASKDKDLGRVMITNRTRALANPLQEYSVQKRLEIWTTIFYYSLRYPFGQGQGSTGYAHSYYFLLLGEVGYPGLLLFLAILFLAFHRGGLVIAQSRDPGEAELARLMLTMVFMISLLNVTGSHMHTNPGDIFFWFSVGTLARMHRQLDGSEHAISAENEMESREPHG